MTRLLLVEDNRGDARLFAELIRELPERPFTLTAVDTLAAALVAVGDHDIVFLDLTLPDAQGLDTLTKLINVARSVPIVVLTGNDDDRIAMDAVKLGAQDYLRKSEITPPLIARTAWYAIERKKAEENAYHLAQSDEAVRRARFISGVTEAITASFDLEVTLRAVAQLLVPQLGDFCVIDRVLDGGRCERVAHAGATPDLDGKLELIYDYAPGAANPKSPALRAIATRQSLVIPELDVAAYAPDARYEAFGRAFALCSMLVTPLVARGRVVAAITYVMGPSQRRHTDETRLLAEEVGERIALGIDNADLYAAAHKAVRARDEMLAVVSHDLRNPLGVVALALEMIKHEQGTSTVVQRATRGVERMQRLIEDLLDVARIEAGTLSVTLEPVELSAVLDDAFEQHRALAAEKRIELQRDYAAQLGVAHVDRHRLMQSLGNLLGNALKFTPAGGKIRIGAQHVEDRIVITVADSGPGIQREHLPHIFDRFWQPERRRDGVGLGLAIVKGIVDAHAGSIEVHSEPGRGAAFMIALRAAAAGRSTGRTAVATSSLS